MKGFEVREREKLDEDSMREHGPERAPQHVQPPPCGGSSRARLSGFGMGFLGDRILRWDRRCSGRDGDW